MFDASASALEVEQMFAQISGDGLRRGDARTGIECSL
jgi:hypothetical protein